MTDYVEYPYSHCILVPTSNDKVFAGGRQMRKEVKDWLNTSVQDLSQTFYGSSMYHAIPDRLWAVEGVNHYGFFEPFKKNPVRSYSHLAFHFRRKDDAMRFKLAWHV